MFVPYPVLVQYKTGDNENEFVSGLSGAASK